MRVFRIIIGILAVIASIIIIANPATGAAAICWILAVCMMIVGFFGIAHYIVERKEVKKAREKGIKTTSASIGSLILGIAAALFSTLALTSGTGAAIFFTLIYVIFSVFIICTGISDIVASSAIRKTGQGSGTALLILGILILLLGIGCLINVFASVVAIGVVVGINLMFFGFSMILKPEA